MKKAILLTMMLATLDAFAAERVSVCDVGGKPASRVEVLRKNGIADSYIYSLRYSGTTHHFFDDPEKSRGLSVRIDCAGKKTRALVAFGEFTSNFLQGFVLINNRAGHIERFDFAERSPPEWLYLGQDETIVVVPTNGYGETEKKYIAYHHHHGSKGEAGIEGIDTLPAATGFEVINLKFKNMR